MVQPLYIKLDWWSRDSTNKLVDFSKTFSLVVKPTTIRIVLIVALAKGWPFRQLDINNAFCNEILKEDME